jgi:hypothetical protein
MLNALGVVQENISKPTRPPASAQERSQTAPQVIDNRIDLKEPFPGLISPGLIEALGWRPPWIFNMAH